MIITRILKRRRERNRYEVSVDDGPAFTLSETLLVKHGLHKGKDLDEHELEDILAEDARERAKQIAINFISYRPRSSKEVVDKLIRKGFPSELSHLVAETLRDVKLVNDLEFARMYVRDKLRGKPMGKALLRRKLSEKGISFQVSERVVKEYVTEESELEAATLLATRKLRASRTRFARLDVLAQQKRLADYLLSRGFSSDLAFKIARTVAR